MPFSPFTQHHRRNQLRLDPTSARTSSERDGYPARATTGDPPDVNASNTFPLTDGAELLVEIDGDTPVTITFNSGAFVDITEATPAEVAAVIDAQPLLTAEALGNRVRVSTLTVGVASSLRIYGGANSALQFPTPLVTGTAGTATLVLGHDAPGFAEFVGDGDYVTATQAVVIDEQALRFIGEVRIPVVPEDSSWRLTIGLGTAVFSWDYATPGTYSLDDFGIGVADIQGAADLTITLAFITTEPEPVLAEFPAVYIDRVESIYGDAPILINRFPYPDQTRVDASGGLTIQFDIATNSLSEDIDTSETFVYIDGDLAYDGTTGTFVAPWNGAGSLLDNTSIYVTDGNLGARIVLQSTGLTFTSEQELEVRVVTQVSNTLEELDTTYSFFTADTVAPSITSALARDLFTVRVQFDDDLDVATATVPTNYVFTTSTVPAVSLTATGVAMVGTDAVDVTVDIEMSPGADYLVTVLNVLDNEGNEIGDNDLAEFTGFAPPPPAGRDFQLWNFLPAFNKRKDTTGDLRMFTLVLQDVVDLLLYKIDRWCDILDVDIAPESYVDAMLLDLGNPFTFVDLSLIDKRRLVRILVEIYKTKGTEPGVINAVRFLTGVEITLDVVNASTEFWLLGIGVLDFTTVLAPPAGHPLWYSFWIDTDESLTDAQREMIFKIVQYMKPAHEHILGIRDADTVATVTPTSWILGESELSIDTILGD